VKGSGFRGSPVPMMRFRPATGGVAGALGMVCAGMSGGGASSA